MVLSGAGAKAKHPHVRGEDTDQITNIDPSTFLNQLSGAELVTFGMLTRNADTQPINGVLYRGVVAATAPSAQQVERWHNGAVTGTASTD